MYKKILLGMDGSEDAKRAALKVIGLCESRPSEIVVFHSYMHRIIPQTHPILVSPITPTYYTIPEPDYGQVQELYRREGQKILKKAEMLFNSANIDVETRLIEDEEPEDYILRISEEQDFDLVVLGCKGHHSKIHQIFMGSVAQKVLNSATKADILIVR
ncbi:MAG: universal stress protein [Candidatus Lokiarchaeota archaeon]|nr:universal stress protein [Candidatus Lokiarchaeota archaeon]